MSDDVMRGETVDSDEATVRDVRRTCAAPEDVAPTVRRQGKAYRWITYQLLDPRTGETRYVGRTTERNLRNRKCCHGLTGRVDGGKHYRNWKRKLGSLGLRPVFDILAQQESESDNLAAEQWAIAVARGLGCRLVNGTDGGDGALGFIATDEFRAKIRESHARDPSRAERLTALHRRRWGEDPDYRARCVATIAAVNGDPKMRAAASARMRESVRRRDAEDPGWRDRHAAVLAEKRYPNKPGQRVYASDGRCFISIGRASRETGVKRQTIARDLSGCVRLVEHKRLWFSLTPETARPLVAVGAEYDSACARRGRGVPVRDVAGRAYPSISAAARATGCTHNGILSVLRGSQRSTHGYVFAYAEAPSK